MISSLAHKTKIIWSSFAQPHLLKELKNKNDSRVGGLRIIHDAHLSQQTADFIKDLHKEAKHPPILLDISQRPQAILQLNQESMRFDFGQTLEIGPAHSSHTVRFQCADWTHLFSPEVKIFINYGQVIFKTISVTKDKACVAVLQGGTVVNGAEVQVPDIKRNSSLLDERFIDIKKYRDAPIEFIILPGVNSEEEVREVRKKLETELSATPWVITRIDSMETYESLNKIIAEVDGIMISRQELMLTADPAMIPMMCKEIIHECNKKAKLVIVASEMLGSMRFNPTPTRAEVSDIANAVIDGTDAVVLSEEISSGEYKERALELCSRTIIDVEKNLSSDINWQKTLLAPTNLFEAVSYQSFKTAERIGAQAIVCITKAGNTVLRIASYRVPTPIIAVTFSEDVKQKLALVRGVSTLVLGTSPELDDVLPVLNERLKKSSWLKAGDRIVLVSVSISPVGREASNLFTVQKID